MWTFYVNRGQGVCCFGVENKDNAAAEFLPANLAYQLAGTQGFRTFIKIRKNKKHSVFEIFKTPDLTAKSIPEQRMILTPYSVGFEEVNRQIGLSFKVTFCNAVNESFPALMRSLEITNISRKPVDFEMLDGLACIIPYGMDDNNLKKMRYLVKSYGVIENLENKIPFFHVRTVQQDSPFVIKVKKGHMVTYASVEKGKAKLIRPFCDPSLIFGVHEDLAVPMEFVNHDQYCYDLKSEITVGKLPCAMGFDKRKLSPGSSVQYVFNCSTVDSMEDIQKISDKVLSPDFFARQIMENRKTIGSIMSHSLTLTADKKLNQYCMQNFLDNVLRGGLPLTLGEKKKSVFHVYSRKHGDMERDYNQFQIAATPYSQGDGNYRDVNQNRRCDLFFNPDTGMTNIITFLNLIQLDGFNPLGVKGQSYVFKGDKALFKILTGAKPDQDVEKFIGKPFTPGELVGWFRRKENASALNEKEMLNGIIDASEPLRNAEYLEGYWSDHWIYNLDLIENYLLIYPEKKKELFWENHEFTFYDDTHRVFPRSDKYVLWDGHPLQMGSAGRDSEKETLIASRKSEKNIVRKDSGKGEIFRTNLLVKLLILCLNKVNSIGPDGSGIEMEADKPGWYDALNGLPGMFGSSINETFETARLVRLLADSIIELKLENGNLDFPAEAAEFMSASRQVMEAGLKNNITSFDLWDQTASLKEKFRSETRTGISGQFIQVSMVQVSEFLKTALLRLEKAIKAGRDPDTGLYHTYFANSPCKYEILKTGDGKDKINSKGLPCIKVKRFESRPLAHFLEGQVHAFKFQKNKKESAQLHQSVLKSSLYDKKLGMFMVNESLDKEPLDIGRARTFTPGWLENQSIWLHMEYKYFLELLKAGLVDEYYKCIDKALVPYLDPAVYGRSIFENSSFIVSSVHPDKTIHGSGFYARLSGSTAEFVNMWIIMFAGERPFLTGGDGKLFLQTDPRKKKM